MAEKIALWIGGIFGAGAGKVLGVFFVAMLPVIELRGAIPVGYALGLSWQTTLLCAIVGNLLPIPFILILLKHVFNWMKKHNVGRKLVLKLEKKAQSRSDRVMKYEFFGLMLFVAIPLPGTGAWTGALVASVMEMNRKQAFLSIFLGVLIASVVVTLATYGIIGSIFR